MIDRRIMRSLLEKMEQAAEETLREDSSFYQAVQALKWEIDNDPQVRATVGELQAAGRSVYSSFVPHIKVRVRTEEGVFALPRPAHIAVTTGVEQVGRLTQELRNAASSVIRKSRYYHQLDTIVNEAVGASDRFEGIASEVESAGYEVLICLDLSAYVEVRGATPPPRQIWKAKAQRPGGEPLQIQLSGNDRKFLQGLKIKIDES